MADFQELKTLIDVINAPYNKSLDRTLANQEELRRAFDLLAQEQVRQAERIKSVEEDEAKIYQEIKELQSRILDNQKKGFTRVIAVQGAILLAIGGTFIGYVLPLLLQWLHIGR